MRLAVLAVLIVLSAGTLWLRGERGANPAELLLLQDELHHRHARAPASRSLTGAGVRERRSDMGFRAFGHYTAAVFEAVRDILLGERRVAYALVFGSSSRGEDRPDSDLDVAVGVSEPFDVHEIRELITDLESACGRTVDLVLMNEAPVALAYRIFRDGVTVVERDRQALVQRKARAILDYLDFKPIEELCTRGVLAAARNGR